MHEFMPPKPFLVFRTEHTQSTILGLKLMFWVVQSHFVAALDTLQKPDRGAFNARVYASRTVSWFFYSKHAQSTTLGQKLMFWFVSRHFVAAPDPLRKLVSGCI